jgi:hypothetical protein
MLCIQTNETSIQNVEVRRKSFMNFKTVDILGLRLFYREAGDLSKPTIVLLHGFPSSS